MSEGICRARKWAQLCTWKRTTSCRPLRDRLGKPLIVWSAYRSPEHNRAVGGATRSKHLDGSAFDVAMTNNDLAAFKAAARKVGFLGFGLQPTRQLVL